MASTSANVGTVTVKIVPDVTGFMDALEAARLSIVLHQFSEWLDGEGFIKGGDDSSHTDLVKQFIEQRSNNARPAIDD